MGKDHRQEALEKLLDIAAKKGYVTFDIIMGCADDYGLSLPDFDWLSNEAAVRNIIIYDEEPATREIDEDEEYDDYAQTDYEAIYTEIVSACPELEAFVDEVRGIKPPQFRESSRLKYLVKEGNVHARERMILMHLRIALRIGFQRAKAYDADVEETIGNACLGLINAVDRYDPDTGGPFASYASFYILQNVTREQPTQNPLMYFPVHKREDYFTVYPLLKARKNLELEDLEHNPEAIDLICERLGYQPDQLTDVWHSVIPFASLDAIMENPDEDEYRIHRAFDSDPIPFEEEEAEKYDTQILRGRINQVLDSLRPRERDVILARYGLDDGVVKTLEEIGQRHNLTRERIRQIENKALRKIGHPSRRRLLKGLDAYDVEMADVGGGKKRGRKPKKDVTTAEIMAADPEIEAEIESDEEAPAEEKIDEPEQAQEVEQSVAVQNLSGVELNADSFEAWLRDEGVDKSAAKDILKAVNRAEQFAKQRRLESARLYGARSLKDARMAIYAINANREFEILEKNHSRNLREFGACYLNYVKHVFSQKPYAGHASTEESEEDDPVIAALIEAGLEFKDNRSKGGCLWAFGGEDLKKTIHKIERAYGVVFRFKADGPQGSSDPAWWTKGQN